MKFAIYTNNTIRSDIRQNESKLALPRTRKEALFSGVFSQKRRDLLEKVGCVCISAIFVKNMQVPRRDYDETEMFGILVIEFTKKGLKKGLRICSGECVAG